MVPQIALRVGAAVAFLFFPLRANAQQPAPALRVWTAANGQKFQAKLVGVEGENVTLLLANGQTSKFALNLLSAADQAAIRAAAAPKTAAPNAPAPAGVMRTVTGVFKCSQDPVRERRNAPNTMIAMPPSFETVATHCTRPATSTPREFTPAKRRITATATTCWIPSRQCTTCPNT